MPKTWFRVHADGPSAITRNRKIQTLQPKLFKWIVNLWAFACRNDGCLPKFEDIAWELHETVPSVSKAVSALVSLGFVEVLDGCHVIHDWSSHQYEQSASTERVRRFRERVRNSGVTVTETDETNNVALHETATRARASESESESVSESVSESEKTTKSSGFVSRQQWEVDDQYAPFVAAYSSAKPNTLPEEFAEAHRAFLALSFEQRLSAVRGIVLRVQWGIWSPERWQMVMKPAKYLQSEWKRVITQPMENVAPARKSKTQTLVDEMNEWAKQEDAREQAKLNGHAAGD